MSMSINLTVQPGMDIQMMSDAEDLLITRCKVFLGAGQEPNLGFTIYTENEGKAQAIPALSLSEIFDRWKLMTTIQITQPLCCLFYFNCYALQMLPSWPNSKQPIIVSKLEVK